MPLQLDDKAMGEHDGMAGRRWSEFLLPAVQGASGGSSEEENEYLKSEHHHEEEEEEQEGDIGKSEDGEDFGDNPSLTFRSSASFASLPSYMRAKSGLEMDPDRYRRRKQMISCLPEAASARKCMQRVATNWDPDRSGPLLGFDCVSLDPTQFKELFRRHFGVLLTAQELGILVSLYDKAGEGRADSAEFLKDFWQLGREGRELQSRRRVQVVRKLHARQKKRAQDRAERMSRLKEVAVGDHTKEDVERALAKITEVAARYDTSRDKGFRQLEQGGVMGPTMFREQLRTIFGARLTRGEVGGLVSAFDLHRDGMVDAKEFAFRFHALGRERQYAKVAEGNRRDDRARRRKREQEEALMSRMKDQSKCKVKWNYSEEELQRGTALIAQAASTYDKVRLGADIDRIAQMKMDPTAFRAQLLQNFRVRLCPGELGAIFTTFDKDKSMLIDGTELMHEFFRLGREERGKKLAEAKQQRHRIDSRERMFRRKLEDRFVEQTAAKVIWPTLPHDPFDEHRDNSDPGSMGRQTTQTRFSSDTSSGGLKSGSRSCAKVGSDGKSRRRFRENVGDGGGEPGGQPVRRRRPKISASTAEFLAQIDKEEMTIRALSSHGRRRGKNKYGKGDAASFFAPGQSVRTTAPAPSPEKSGSSGRPSRCEGGGSVAAKKGRSSGRLGSASGSGFRFHPDIELEGEQRRSNADNSGNAKQAALSAAAGKPEPLPPSCLKTHVQEDERPVTSLPAQSATSERALDGVLAEPDGRQRADAQPPPSQDAKVEPAGVMAEAFSSGDAGPGIARPGSCAGGMRDSRGSTGSRGLDNLDGHSESSTSSRRDLSTTGSTARSSRGGESRSNSIAEAFGSRGGTIPEHGDGLEIE